VAAIILDIPADTATAQALENRIAAASAESDSLLFTNGDQLTGEIAGRASDKLTLKAAEADFQVDRSRVAAMVFRGAKSTDRDQAGGLTTWVGLRDGSRLLARRLVTDRDRATIDRVAGGTVVVKRAEVIALQPVGGDVVYLSDLSDSGYRHIPFLSLSWHYRRDKNVAGGALTAEGNRYLKGLGTHSAARVTYSLDGEFREFQSELAIDDSTGGRGSSICRIFADDGSGKWQLKFESPMIRGGNKPIPVRADLRGAKRVSLLVEFADRGDEQDHVNWLDARLVR
jgi:hypothetical protein